MKKAFTLLELLVVITIMGIMGSLAVSGYRQMRRGMEERSVVQNVNQFMVISPNEIICNVYHMFVKHTWPFVSRVLF